ncbi:chromosome segregation protein SMC [Actinotalea sp. M2MS4P-6]|uniref:chromosome segregation protein SMC n=1 Tax=Actinotalea sp. M2MS4P-6 TaxID=2983762 RepID=UPI0021E3FC6B|nr:chromosome segregation protein SMC [Actinotalea sp. M2MS4P-6]MCV2396077.1 chromosome segregation protein SMC [Actinotalea sp. M2MS4P-6]
MHLKTLTLRGFKSFASATTLGFEPGITCVVGPNGSGKSNVVDALAWVMGEQGAKSLRGGSMEDVIFAGTAGRPPLGRAEVALTIDNSDGHLPIDYTEVTISRTLFRNGGSEYAINGSSCRLLDIQELLSDTGMGREMHVIVGQGQLDAVLRANPEDRRHFIEEAAGVLKHRRRKEKALRKLDAMQANLTRLTDLTGEIRRQLGPLGRQAEVARRAAGIQADVRDARARLLADDLAQLTATLEQEIADESALLSRRDEVETSLARARATLADLEAAAAAAAPELSAANDVYFRLSGVRERLRGLATLAEERSRLLGGAEQELPVGQDPDDLDAQAARARAAEAELSGEVDVARGALEAAVSRRAEVENAAAAAERRVAELQRAAADRREGLARLAGQVAARRTRLEATEAEIGRLEESLAEAERRGHEATVEFAALESTVAGVEEGEEGLDADHEAATVELDEATTAVAELERAEQVAERDRATWQAKVEALELSLERKDGAGALLAADDLAGVLGSVAALLGVEPGYEDAITAALGPLADAVAVGSVDDAVDALRRLRSDDAGRAGLLIGRGGDLGGPPADLPAGAVPAVELVRPAPAVAAAIGAALSGVVVVEDLAHARALLGARPELVAVTRSGDLLGAVRAWGGSAAAPGALELQATLEEARARVAEATAVGERTRFELVAARRRTDEAGERHEATLDRLHESDAALAAVAEQLGHLGSVARAARGEAERAAGALAKANERLAEDQRELTELADRLQRAEADPSESESDLTEAVTVRDAASAEASAARAKETEARLALRTGEERVRAVAGRAESLERAATAEREAREAAATRARRRAAQAAQARAVGAGAHRALTVIEDSLAEADAARRAAELARAERDAALVARRADVDRWSGEFAQLTDAAHRDEVARAQQVLRIEQLQTRAIEELGVDPEVLVEEFGPHRSVPGVDQDGEQTEAPYVREEQEKRLRKAERELSQLGRVNPLALEEFAALEERHAFLTGQLGDLTKSRTDLLQIVKDIDEKVEQVFAEAYADTAVQFERVFARLFPGGEGRLVLTDPSDMLGTGIEVEARPAGKKVKRLSLLSGGERSLTAVALLVAIFKARPSPFYVMDEVEAALDDVNLGRLLEIFTELRDDSQLIVVTHQKRTMEIADALYGVTMRGDGVTTVISQRLREED